jgi:hypothetical protein
LLCDEVVGWPVEFLAMIEVTYCPGKNTEVGLRDEAISKNLAF